MAPVTGTLKKLATLYSCRKVLWDTTLKSFKSRYSGSYFGFGWSFIIPLLLAGSIQFVFGAVFRVPFPGYGLFVLSGIIPWMFFNNALFNASNSFGDLPLARKTPLREILPFSCVLSEFIVFWLGLCVLLPFFAFMNHRLIAVFPALVLASLLLLVFSAGLALIIAPSALLVRDLTHALPVLFMVLFWVTPVFYAPQMIPPKFAFFNALNPVGWFIALFRETLFDCRIPSLQAFGAAACASCISLFAGLVFFSYKEQQLLKTL